MWVQATCDEFTSANRDFQQELAAGTNFQTGCNTAEWTIRSACAGHSPERMHILWCLSLPGRGNMACQVYQAEGMQRPEGLTCSLWQHNGSRNSSRRLYAG